MRKKALVVDDNPDVRLFSVAVLEKNGYTTLEAEDGESGLRIIKAEIRLRKEARELIKNRIWLSSMF